jgi:hypothetical protein
MRTLIAGAALLACTLSTYAAAEEIVCGEEGGILLYEDVVDEGCTSILGSLKVEGDVITDLNGLSNLTSVSSNIFIFNAPLLTHVDGLSSLTSAGGISIINAFLLTHVDGLSNLTSAARVTIGTTGITNVDGLSSLEKMVKGRPYGDGLFLSGNSALTNIDGLINLTTIDGNLSISSNSALTSIDGLKNLTSVSSALRINDNSALTNVDGLINLTTAGFLRINDNSALTNIDGLINLTTLTPLPEWTVFLRVESNSALTSIDGLKNLDTDSIIYIGGNAVLENCGAVAPLVLPGALGDLLIGAELPHRESDPNGLDIESKVVIDGAEQPYGGNANTKAGCIEDYVPQTSSERLSDLIETTTQMNLANGIANAYDSKLTSAFSALDDTNTKNDGAAFNKLYAFINSVEAQRGGKLSDSEADLLIASAMRVIDNLPE